jgi:hypothetical protein
MLRSRLVRIGAAAIVGVIGFVAYEAVTQVAGAQPPPVINTDYAAYPPANALPPGCTADGGGFLLGYRTFIDPNSPTVTTARRNANPTDFEDLGPGAGAGGSMTRFETRIVPNDRVVARWTGWAPNCGADPVSFPLKATNGAFFDVRDDQALVREPNGPFSFPFCFSSGPESCPTPANPQPPLPTGVTGGFELSTIVPQLDIVCGYQLDMVIGGPLETIGPHGSYYATVNRQNAAALGLGTFNTGGANMLIDRANGAMPCAATNRIVIDKQWVGTGTVPPSNVPPDFQLVVTSSVSQTNSNTLGTATCGVANGAFTCSYIDANAPGQQQGGLLVTADSLLTVTETGFPGNTVDITFPVGMSSQYVACQSPTGPCLFTITNTPPPAPTTTTTTVPVIQTTIPNSPTSPPTSFPDIPDSTLPATGSSGTRPLLLLALAIVPLGAALILITRRRSAAQ